MAKEKLSKRMSLSKALADKFYKTNMTYNQMLHDILYLWGEAYEEGYDDRLIDWKKLKNSREALLLRGFNMMRDAIDSKIHEINK